MRVRPLRRVAPVRARSQPAPLLSSVIHSGVPAQVAGVKELVVRGSPPHGTKADIDPAILGVAGALGITEVYRMGGAHAMAALAMGTQRVPRVDKIVGPGGMYVQLAKRYLYGIVDIDMFAATTEVLIVADSTARPAYVAADMLAQAEHNPGCSILLTDDPSLVDRVLDELDRQLQTLSTAEPARKWLAEFGAIARRAKHGRRRRPANEIAPSISSSRPPTRARSPSESATREPISWAILRRKRRAITVAGPSHVLPTGGTARFRSGVSALSFLRYTSSPSTRAKAWPGRRRHRHTLARAERLEGHARSATIRVRD